MKCEDKGPQSKLLRRQKGTVQVQGAEKGEQDEDEDK